MGRAFGSFHAVLPHNVMVSVFGMVFAFVVVAFARRPLPDLGAE